MVLWREKSCQEMCGTTLWVGEQDDSTTLLSIYSMHRWSPLQGRRMKICWRVFKSMLSNFSKMLIFGTNWKTWYSMDSKQTCRIHHKMDQSLWQTLESIDFENSSDLWIQTVLLCGKYCQSNADWDCFKTLTSQEILKIQNPLLEELCASLEVIHLSQ